MENTIENKAKFFAQYWGQAILRMPEETVLFISNQNNLSYEEVLEQGWLILKPLSSISDEDAIALSHESHKDAAIYYAKWKPNAYDSDYLRSKGYALPWMGLSVEKQIEYGWVNMV